MVAFASIESHTVILAPYNNSIKVVLNKLPLIKRTYRSIDFEVISEQRHFAVSDAGSDVVNENEKK